MAEMFDPEAQKAESRELRWREQTIQRELAEALRHYLRILCPDEDSAEHTRWLQVLAERTVECLTSFYGGNHPWYDFETAPEALKLAVQGRPDFSGPFDRLIIEHEPSCAGAQDAGWRMDGHCRCRLRIRRDDEEHGQKRW